MANSGEALFSTPSFEWILTGTETTQTAPSSAKAFEGAVVVCRRRVAVFRCAGLKTVFPDKIWRFMAV